MSAEHEYREAIKQLEDAQSVLGATPRDDIDVRKVATQVVDAAHVRVREAKELVKQENARRNFAGLGSPIHEAIVARLSPDVVAKLEADALRRLREREERSAARRAAKQQAAAPPPTPPPRAAPPERRKPAPPPEIIHLRGLR